MRIQFITGLSTAVLALLCGGVEAQTVSTEDFTGTGTVNNWYYYNGACLTAGSGSGSGTGGRTAIGTGTAIAAVAGTPPSCVSILSSYYQTYGQLADPALVGGQNGAAGNAQTLPDPTGQGALRFTNGYPYGKTENGAIISATPFDAGQGVSITFKTVTYRGGGSGVGNTSGSDGADGISFYLIDANKVPANSTYWNGVGAFGGSLGYTCSNNTGNPPDDGLVGGYLAVGIDEYGNFLNGLTVAPGYPTANSGDNTAYGYGRVPQRIGLRGAGSVSWKYLNGVYPQYYPSSLANTPGLTAQVVRNTCANGVVLDYSSTTKNYASCPEATTYSLLNPNCPVPVPLATPTLYDYAILGAGSANPAFAVLPASPQIAGEYASGIYSRPQATPIYYKLNITQDGLLSLSYAFAGSPAYTSIISNRSISSTNALPTVPSKLYFGFAGSSGGSTNIHEIMCFKAAPASQAASSAALGQQQSSKLQTNSQVYFSYYNPNDWTGRVTANGLVDTAGVLSINALANWDAQCVLTGVGPLLPYALTSCATTGATGPTAAQATSSRVMLTWNGNATAAVPGTAGVPFEWPVPATPGGSITTSQQATLTASDLIPNTSARLDYLRGGRTNEINTLGIGLFRARNGVLGDIVDSSPAWVGPPSLPYTMTWKDRLFTSAVMNENSGQSYSTFQSTNQSRLNVLYAGSNDGFMHGFEAGALDTSGNLIDNSATPNDGLEVLAYMPAAVLQTIHNTSNASLDLSNSQYAHAFFVDGAPGTGDLYYGAAWHTWLVGGLGAGGSAFYALDVTNPKGGGTTQFSETNAANLVKGEWGPATIKCINSAGTPVTGCGNSMGNNNGTPIIRRLHNGQWGVIFGNGYGSATGDSGIFIMTVDPNDTTGSANNKFYYLSATNCTTTSPCGNGIAYVTSADLDGDHITDYVYAGDLKGNVWRFDLTSCTPASTSGTCTGWTVSSGPLFKTPTGQPITTPVVLATSVVAGSAPEVIVSFGTGQRTQFTTTTATSYASGTQSLYGVWDWNFGAWNAISTSTYASLTGAQVKVATGGTSGVNSPYTLGVANLQAQTFSIASGGVDSSNSTVTYTQCSSATSCTNGGFGWYANLIGSSEQVVSAPTLFQQALIVNSVVPANNAILSCTQNVDTGFSYVISVTTGGTFTTASGSKTSAFVTTNRDVNLAGLPTSLSGALTVVTTKENTTYLVGQSITPASYGQAPAQPIQIALPPNVTVNRLTWSQLR